ncbi:unnamed protein product [Discosporangium mesarthrocarpum]
MELELTGLQNTICFSPAELPPDRKATGAKWICKWQTDEMGVVTRGKARLVAKGCSQKLGVLLRNTCQYPCHIDCTSSDSSCQRVWTGTNTFQRRTSFSTCRHRCRRVCT